MCVCFFPIRSILLIVYTEYPKKKCVPLRQCVLLSKPMSFLLCVQSFQCTESITSLFGSLRILVYKKKTKVAPFFRMCTQFLYRIYLTNLTTFAILMLLNLMRGHLSISHTKMMDPPIKTEYRNFFFLQWWPISGIAIIYMSLSLVSHIHLSHSSTI